MQLIIAEKPSVGMSLADVLGATERNDGYIQGAEYIVSWCIGHGVHAQKLTIHYNCIGTVEIPNVLPLPQPEVTIQTRKGVAVSYSQSQITVNF